MSLSDYSTAPSSNNWGYPLYLCDCCPYGYHIDLDFVRYCESISKEADRTGSIKRRKDRRRQRKSMEVLLGLSTFTENNNMVNAEPVSPIIETENILLQKQDSFDNVIDDFEKTFQISNKKLSNNLPDVTAVSDIRRKTPMSVEAGPTLVEHITVKKFSNKEFEGTNDYCNLSPTTFKNIREQMALSLERTRQLEEQMKQLPELKSQISTLKNENERLLKKLVQQKEVNVNSINFNYLKSFHNGGKDKIDSYENKHSKTKDIGITCSVLTRNVGVGHQTPSRKNVSTETSSENMYVDKWFGEKLKFVNDQYEKENIKKLITINKSSQTQMIHNQNEGTQTTNIPVVRKCEKQIQTISKTLDRKNQSSQAIPSTVDRSIQEVVEVYNIGVSDDTTTDVNCEKCNVVKINVAVGPDNNEDAHVAPISLACLSVPRSKSFNLGNDKINLSTRSRCVGVQYQYKPITYTKSSQYENSTLTKSCQSTIKTHSKASQHDFTEPIKIEPPSTRNVACEAKEYGKSKTISCNTSWTIHPSDDRNYLDQEKEILINKTKKEESKKKDEIAINVSRIPRLSTPDQRKFTRQDTYTKISSIGCESNTELSGLDLTAKSPSITTSPFDKVKEAFKFTEASKEIELQNEITRPIIKPFEPSTNFGTPYISAGTQPKQRKTTVPSKEMRGAIKVMNDSLLKQTKVPKNSKAISIIQKEWFEISGLPSANPLDVEDYLDAFEDMSSLLLDYIVNITDDSGNTAMHYAVSHGNFDVVSILLDSKVCDINKTNKAGYTSVMLVSLADIRSPTHANVVRRLFQMADVNIRASQHGQTALMLAVSHGRLDMVKMLLEAGADINIQDDDGSTALMCASEHGHIEIVKYFLSQPDCDSTITDIDGSTALKIAMEAGHRPIGVLLYAHERNLIPAQGHKQKKKSSSPKPPSSPLSVRHSQSALNEVKISK